MRISFISHTKNFVRLLKNEKKSLEKKHERRLFKAVAYDVASVVGFVKRSGKKKLRSEDLHAMDRVVSAWKRDTKHDGLVRHLDKIHEMTKYYMDRM